MKERIEYVIMGCLVGVILFMSIGFYALNERVEYLEERMSQQIQMTNKQSLDIWKVHSKLDRLNLYWNVEKAQ